MAVKDFTMGDLLHEIDECERLYNQDFHTYNSFDYWSEKEYDGWGELLDSERDYLSALYAELNRREGGVNAG